MSNEDESLAVLDFSDWDGRPFFEGNPPKGRSIYIVNSRENGTFTASGVMDEERRAFFVVRGALSELPRFLAQMELEGVRVEYGSPPTDTRTGGDQPTTTTSRPGIREQVGSRGEEVTLHLLLARSGDGQPFLEQPFSKESLEEAPCPVPLPTPTHLHNMAASPDSLREQRWALVLPDTERGRRLEAILAPLCALRAEGQGSPVDVYRAPEGMNAAGVRDFLERVVYPPSRPPREQARYLLLAGTPEELSMDLQFELMGDGVSLVGRLPFQSEDDYSAYVTKVVAREQCSTPPRQGRALFLTAQDDSPAVLFGQQFVMQPTVQRCQEARQKRWIPNGDIVAEECRRGTKRRLLELAGAGAPSLLMTLSHGVGGRLGGWSSVEDQLRHQGDMVLGNEPELVAEEVSGRAFLPGGIWFYMACFGAGTPARSLYEPWMRQLVQSRAYHPELVERLLQTRPLDSKSFIAALPQAALANPEGPLAVISHMDFAWIYAFHNPRTGQTHVNRLEEVLLSLLEGRRAGLALHVLSRFAWKADVALAKSYQEAAEAAISPMRQSVDVGTRDHLWMERHDVMSYVLLGDPAVRLVEPLT